MQPGVQSRLQTVGWDRFAREDAYTYIKTDVPHGDHTAFWQSGEQFVRSEFLPIIDKYQVSPGIALEIGCGIGRLMFALSSRFRKIVGVDISAEMIARGESQAAKRTVVNAQFLHVSNPSQLNSKLTEASGNVDFLYSCLVFQHIADLGIIEGYIRSVHSLLSPRGIAYLQFDTRPHTLLYHTKMILPDWLLPRFWRSGIRRIRRAPAQLEEFFDRNGLVVLDNVSARTDNHRYLLKRLA
jgi:cyclopropane fatty-acyl-phospholipid synthase-like methyltransferase